MKATRKFLSLFSTLLMIVSFTAIWSMSVSATDYKTISVSAHTIPANSTTLYWHGARSYYPARGNTANGGSYSAKLTYSAKSHTAVGHSNYSTGAKVCRSAVSGTQSTWGVAPLPTYTYRLYCTNGSRTNSLRVTGGSISAVIY